MKKVLLWIAKVFKVNLIEIKTVIKTEIKEVIKEIPKEVVIEVPKEVIKEVITYKVIKKDLTTDFTVKGNLVVEGSLDVTGEITCYKINTK